MKGPTEQYTILENHFLSKATCMFTACVSVLFGAAQHMTVQLCYYFNISVVHLLPIGVTCTFGRSHPFVIISITL